MASTQVLSRAGIPTGLRPILAGVLLVLPVPALPAQAGSPCDSQAVISEAQEALRPDCEILWKFYTELEDPGVLDDAENPNAWLSTTPFAE